MVSLVATVRQTIRVPGTVASCPNKGSKASKATVPLKQRPHCFPTMPKPKKMSI